MDFESPVPIETREQMEMPPADLRNYRYCEVLPAFSYGVRICVEVYNTLSFNDCPEEDWAELNAETLQEELDAMKFAVRVCEQVKSNAIVMVQGVATVGIGPGQTSRVEAVRIASRRAGERAKGCVLASDAFFPFADGLEQAAQAGASAIVQPGGSIRDDEVIQAADNLGISMLFTGHRLFRH